MYDLHTHTYLSDGVLGPAELARRCRVQGYRGLVISDHCDQSNIEHIVRSTVRFCEAARGTCGEMRLLPGCEITHAPPALVGDLVERARELGARVVLVHGETLVEPVEEGTNRAGIEAGADVLAHPGLIEAADARLAAEKEVRLEISGRKGHCLTNGHVARAAQEHGARLSFGSDGHAPGDFPRRGRAMDILRGAGLNPDRAEGVLQDGAALFEHLT